MIGRIVEVATPGRFICRYRGFLLIKQHGAEVGRVPLDDIAALVLSTTGLTFSTNVLEALAARNVPVVCCGRNHLPTSYLLPLDGYHEQAHRMDAQLAATRPLTKRLWKQIVVAKVQQQCSVLSALDRPSKPLQAMVRKVRAGDPDNIEAQAARLYWLRLFGDNFRRNRAADGINALLNYGYTILRSTTARSLVAAGLHPTLGLHHQNHRNPMRLADDLMEVFRPAVDLVVSQLVSSGLTDVDAHTKKCLVGVLYLDMPAEWGASPLINCIQRCCSSLGNVFEHRARKLDLPLPAGNALLKQGLEQGAPEPTC